MKATIQFGFKIKNDTLYLVLFMVLYGRGGIVVREHASRAEGLRFESDSMP